MTLTLFPDVAGLSFQEIIAVIAAIITLKLFNSSFNVCGNKWFHIDMWSICSTDEDLAQYKQVVNTGRRRVESLTLAYSEMCIGLTTYLWYTVSFIYVVNTYDLTENMFAWRYFKDITAIRWPLTPSIVIIPESLAGVAYKQKFSL